jgi:hypothetical protein
MGKEPRRRLASVVRGLVLATVACVLAVGALAATHAIAKPSAKAPSSAQDQYGNKCNSGRGNGSEGSNAQLVDPHAGGSGPGVVPTVDCDPGNSGGVNRGGD